MKSVRIYPGKKTVLSLAEQEVISLAGETVVVQGDLSQEFAEVEELQTEDRPKTSPIASTAPLSCTALPRARTLLTGVERVKV